MTHGGIPHRTFVIVATRYVVPLRRFAEPPYTEIIAGASQDADTARLTLITRDEGVAARAMALEGTESRVAINWHCEQAPRTRRLVIETIG
jgi:hypothetical protein